MIKEKYIEVDKNEMKKIHKEAQAIIDKLNIEALQQYCTDELSISLPILNAKIPDSLSSAKIESSIDLRLSFVKLSILGTPPLY